MIKSLSFVKMHGLGNDFAVIYSGNPFLISSPQKIKSLADRHIGIGFDQLIWLEKSTQVDFCCRFFNADGSEADQCGNGLRCAARFVQEEKLSQKNSLIFHTKVGFTKVTIHDYNNIEVDLGTPRFMPHLAANIEIISLGNIHAITQVPDINTIDVIELIKEKGIQKDFPKGINIGFMQILNPHSIRLRTVERGSGETLACGSNACAAVVTGIKQKLLTSPVLVKLTYGMLKVEWGGAESSVILKGPAARVYSGSINLF